MQKIIVGTRELKQRANELVHMVHKTGKEVQVTYHGEVVALLIPVKRRQKDRKDAWARLDDLAEEIGARWPKGVSTYDDR